MEDRVLKSLALVVSFIGLLALVFLYDVLVLPESGLEELENFSVDSYIAVNAEIGKVSTSTGMYILQLRDDNNYVKAVVFSDEKLNLDVGDIVFVEGKVTEYKGEKEIIVSKIEFL